MLHVTVMASQTSVPLQCAFKSVTPAMVHLLSRSYVLIISSIGLRRPLHLNSTVYELQFTIRLLLQVLSHYEHPDGQEFYQLILHYGCDVTLRRAMLQSPLPYLPPKIKRPRQCHVCGFESTEPNVALHKQVEKHLDLPKDPFYPTVPAKATTAGSTTVKGQKLTATGQPTGQVIWHF